VVETAKEGLENSRRRQEDGDLGQSLERLSTRIICYGKVMDALAHHHPEPVALVWATMKFVLTVGYTCSKTALSLVVY